jgi:predicted MFS family arabinose efflux permease
MTRKNTALIAFICALAVGNLYDAQPLMVEIAATFGATPEAVGLVATLAQVGYGLGVLLLVPLGDAVERRRLVLVLLCLVGLAMAAAGAAPTLGALVVAHFMIGLTTVTPQILIPYAATLAAPKERATVLGIIQSTLLVGILLARTFAGAVGALWGWRSIFFVGAALSWALALAVRLALPAQPVAARLGYGALLRSMAELGRSSPGLWRASWASAGNFAAFSAFWTTLAFLIDESYHLGPAVVGLFGLVGVAGALGASWAGRAADRYGAKVAQQAALWLTVFAFGLFYAAPHSLLVLVTGVVLMDAGVQAAHLALQAEVFSLREDARSRLNGIYMFMRFAGGATGSLVGAWSWHAAGWMGVCSVGVAFCVAAACCVGKPPLRPMPSHKNGSWDDGDPAFKSS